MYILQKSYLFVIVRNRREPKAKREQAATGGGHTDVTPGQEEREFSMGYRGANRCREQAEGQGKRGVTRM